MISLFLNRQLWKNESPSIILKVDGMGHQPSITIPQKEQMVNKVSSELQNRGHAAIRVECAGCGTSGHPADRFCSKCGGEVLRTCGACTAPLRHPVALYCSNCGALLEPGPSGVAAAL
jgi:hypothetical protein